MAILYNKGNFGGKKVFDNITYLMQKTEDEGNKKTPEEMQAIADEKNRQMKLLGLKNKTVVWPENKEFNEEGLDPNDDVVIIGDRQPQQDYIENTFKQNEAAADWAYGDFIGRKGVGKSQGASYNKLRNKYYMGKWGAVDTPSSMHLAKSSPKNSNLSVLAYLLGHESGHNFSIGYDKAGHYGKGLMASGDVTQNLLTKEGKTIDELLSLDLPGNKKFVEQILKYRQYGDPNREAVDNYDENIRKYKMSQEVKSVAPLSSSLEVESLDTPWNPVDFRLIKQ